MGTTYHNKPIVTDGLVFCVDPANKVSYPGSGTTATDLINKVEGTLSGAGGSNNTPQWENTNFGAFDFDGTDDYIDYGNHANFSFGDGTDDSPFSMNAWINPDTNIPNRIINKVGSGGGEYLFTTGTANRVGLLLLYNGADGSTSNNYTFKCGTTTQVLNQWQNIVATYDGSGDFNGIKIYYNGVLESGATNLTGNYSAMNAKSSPLVVGGAPNWLNDYNNGKISPTYIYNKVLTQAEVTQNYNALKNRFI
jgi:hypothetical protein